MGEIEEDATFFLTVPQVNECRNEKPEVGGEMFIFSGDLQQFKSHFSRWMAKKFSQTSNSVAN